MTLVEMIVSFTLLSMFMVAATMMIASIVNVYYQSSTLSYGLEVANVINNKIRGELEAAVGSDMASAVEINAEGNEIHFVTATGSRVFLGLAQRNGQNYLVEHFEAIEASLNEDGTYDDDGYDAVDWMFDEAAYMGYVIDELHFSMAKATDPSYEENVIKVDLVISNPRYGEFNTEKYVKCYKIRK